MEGAPLLIVLFQEEEFWVIGLQRVLDIFGERAIRVRQSTTMKNAFSLLYSYKLVDHKYVKQLLAPFALKIYGGSKPMVSINVEPLAAFYKEFYFSEEDCDIIVNEQDRQLAATQGSSLINPMMIIMVNSYKEAIRAQLNALYRGGFILKFAKQGDYDVYGALFASTIISPSYIRGLIGGNIMHFELGPIKQFKMLLPTTMLYISFEASMLYVIRQINNTSIQNQIQQLPNDMVGPNLVVYCLNKRAFKDIFSRINNLYDSMMMVKSVQLKDHFYIGVLFNVKTINCDTLWYSIPKDIKRFVQGNYINYPPKICPLEAFKQLLFTKAEYNYVYSGGELVVAKRHGTAQMVGPRIIVYFSSQQELCAFKGALAEKYSASHLHFTSCGDVTGLWYLGILFDDRMLQTSTIRQFFNESTVHVVAKQPITAPPPFLSDRLFEQLLFPHGIYVSITEMSAFLTEKYHVYRPAKQVKFYRKRNIELLPDSVIYFIDFEAYFYNKTSQHPSEVAIVRVQCNRISATVHGFFKYNSAWFDTLSTKDYYSAMHVYNLTRIPLSNQPAYYDLSPKIDVSDLALFIDDLQSMSSTELQLKYAKIVDIDIISSYARPYKNLYYIFCAKGIQLEQLIFDRLLHRNHHIVEYVSIAKSYCLPSGSTFQNIHSKQRKYNYCAFHYNHSVIENDGQTTHCAFDDALYLASKFISSFRGWNSGQGDYATVECYPEIEEASCQKQQNNDADWRYCRLRGDSNVIWAMAEEFVRLADNLTLERDYDGYLLVNGGCVAIQKVLAFFEGNASCDFL